MRLLPWRLQALGVAALVSMPGIGVAADANAQRDLIRQRLRLEAVQLTAPIVEYCRASAPSHAAGLDEGYAKYLSLMESARESWIKTLSPAQLNNAPSPQELKAVAKEMKTMFDQIMTSVRRQDPDAYCLALVERLRAVTPAVAAKSVANAQAQIDAARSKPAPSTAK
jgi:hypothetical protein